MLIQCTKKLLEQLKIKPHEPIKEQNPLFSWHAHFILVNRRKTIVLIHDLSRYIIVLHGLKAKDYKYFDQLIVNAIRETFEAEGVKKEVIEQFLTQSMDFTYSKTKDRTSVARLNKACETTFYFLDYLNQESVINSELSKRVSRSLVGDGKNKYVYPNEEMYKQLEIFSGQPIFETKAVQLKVALKLEDHQVWRRIIVPVNRTFHDLHKILQSTFGWKNNHLHEFIIYNADAEPTINLVSVEKALTYPKQTEMKHEKGIKLSEYMPAYKTLTYTYDFGDDWKHEIEVEKVINEYHDYHPQCVDGEGNAPPEDVGGVPGYTEFLSILANPEHQDYKHTVHWGIMQGYEEFDIEMINRMLKDR
ncbi:MAG TPA: plasmid pRiA4b ORF-3 family protein [Ureibacillus sp.]|nr:plasmid pRiA4b ORF-3 family protein [Ureibacillus sp.]